MFLFIACLTLLTPYDCFLFSWSKPKQLPEVTMNSDEIIKYNGYPCERHHVTTKDGYIITMQRIPHGLKPSTITPKPVVLLIHGLIDSSFTWVNNGPKKSLGFILADRGFDVWLGNVRGNIYSNTHETISNTSRKYWDFSWEEMAEYDLPSMIDYALSVTKATKLSYIGHSQGTEIAFAQFSDNPDWDKKISSFVAFTPVTYLGNVKSIFRYLLTLGLPLNMLMSHVGTGEFLPSKGLISKLGVLFCGFNIGSNICGNLLFIIQGYNPDSLDLNRLPIYLSHVPAGTSSKNMAHYGQSILSNDFLTFDHGYAGNMKKYNQATPRKYKLENIKVPIGMFWGGKDTMAVPKDVERTIASCGESVKLKKYVPEYNHIDFVWAKDAYKKIYPDVVEFILKYST